MAVLVEAISVIVRRESIDRSFGGGWEAFKSGVSNATLCTDGEVVRVGFMDPQSVDGFVSHLRANGLTFMAEGKCADIAVIDQQRGLTTACGWLEFAKIPFGKSGQKVAACWLFEGPRLADGIHMRGDTLDLHTPPGWTFEESLSHKFTFVQGGEEENRLQFVRSENGVEQSFVEQSLAAKIESLHLRQNELTPTEQLDLDRLTKQAINLAESNARYREHKRVLLLEKQKECERLRQHGLRLAEQSACEKNTMKRKLLGWLARSYLQSAAEGDVETKTHHHVIALLAMLGLFVVGLFYACKILLEEAPRAFADIILNGISAFNTSDAVVSFIFGLLLGAGALWGLWNLCRDFIKRATTMPEFVEYEILNQEMRSHALADDKIVSDYAAFVTKSDGRPDYFYDVNMLPHPKEAIIAAIEREIVRSPLEEHVVWLRTGAGFLWNFLEGIGPDPLPLLGVNDAQLELTTPDDPAQLRELAEIISNNPNSERAQRFRAIAEKEAKQVEERIAAAVRMRSVG